MTESNYEKRAALFASPEWLAAVADYRRAIANQTGAQRELPMIQEKIDVMARLKAEWAACSFH